MRAPVKKTLSKIIWALDPMDVGYDEAARLELGAVRTIEKVIERLEDPQEVEIEPVYVLSPGQLGLSEELGPAMVTQYRPAAERAMHSLLQHVNLPQLVAPKLIVRRFGGVAMAVHSLADYATASGADLIVACTHRRQGLRRFLMGSFVERLVLYSSTPVLVSGSELRKKPDFQKIVFPTAFEEGSEDIYRRVIALASALGAEVTLYHAFRHGMEPVVQSGVYLLGGAWMSTRTLYDRWMERQARHADSWARWAEHLGVKVEVYIDTQGGSIADCIVALSKRINAGIIAMDVKSGPVATALLGSTARQVIRAADCPVWVLRAQTAAAETRVLRLPRARAA